MEEAFELIWAKKHDSITNSQSVDLIKMETNVFKYQWTELQQLHTLAADSQQSWLMGSWSKARNWACLPAARFVF